MGRFLCVILLVAAFALPRVIADDTPATATESPVNIEADDIQGQPEQDLVKVTNARYFVWHDSKGWHLRTAAKALTQFSGSIRIEGASFGKLRPIGLEAKARNPDRWEVNTERTEIRFQIHTVGSFDGFDFDLAGGDPSARVGFDLSQGREGRHLPRRIFLGRDSKHPQKSLFECTAHPDKAAGDKAADAPAQK